MALPAPTSATHQSEQHSVTESVLLHLAPGIPMVTAFALAAPRLVDRGLPAVLGLYLAMGLVLMPTLLAILYVVGWRRNGRLSLDGVVLYRERLPGWQTAGLALAVVTLAVGASLLAQPLDRWLLQFFGWIPEWFRVPLQVEGYDRSLLLGVWGLAAVLNGVVSPVVEELYFRGYLLPRMERMGAWAPLVSTVLFSLYHLFSPWANLSRLLGFLPQTYAVWWKRSVWLGMITHCTVNTLANLLLLAVLMG